jgi:hypothetical protein
MIRVVLLLGGCVASLARAQVAPYIQTTQAPWPFPVPQGWLAAEFIAPASSAANAFDAPAQLLGPRVVRYASLPYAVSTFSGRPVFVDARFYVPDEAAGNTSVTVASSAVLTIAQFNHTQTSPSFTAADCYWALNAGGNKLYYEVRARRTASSMSFAAWSPSQPDSISRGDVVIILTASAPPTSSSDGAWTSADVQNALNYAFELKRDFQRFYFGYDEEPSIYDFQQLGTDMGTVQESVSSLDGKMDSLISSVDSILMELINPSSYNPTKSGVYGSGSTPSPFSTFGSSIAKPGIDSARGTLGEFNDPFQGAPVSIPGGSAIDSPTVSATGMSFSVDMRELGGGLLPAGVDATVLPGVQTLAVSFGPVQPFIDICRWLMIGLVTLFSAERVFSEFRRL